VDSVELENRLRLLIEAAGFHLMASHWKPLKGKRLLRVVADAEDHNITVDECAGLSRAISDLLDSYPHDFPDYRLEVSSPGLEHPLERWQFRKNLGRLVEVHFLEDGEARSCRGDLISIAETEIGIQAKGQVRTVALENVQHVLVLPRI